LPRIYRFISQDNPAAAERVLEAIERTFEQLAGQPEAGVRYRSGRRELADVRMLPVSGFANYLLFYRIDADVVRVLYVLHGAQHLRELFRREPRI
jgi:toxin ParE1/3/4